MFQHCAWSKPNAWVNVHDPPTLIVLWLFKVWGLSSTRSVYSNILQSTNIYETDSSWSDLGRFLSSRAQICTDTVSCETQTVLVSVLHFVLLHASTWRHVTRDAEPGLLHLLFLSRPVDQSFTCRQQAEFDQLKQTKLCISDLITLLNTWG